MADNRIPDPFPHAMQWGLAGGACFALHFLCSASSAGIAQTAALFLEALVVIATWRIARDYRDTECAGVITFRQAFAYIFLLFLFSSLLGAVVKLGYMQFINRQYLPTLLNQTLQILQQYKPDFPADTLDQLRTAVTPVRFAVQSVFVDMLLGTFIGLCYAPFLRKNANIDPHEPLDNSATLQ